MGHEVTGEHRFDAVLLSQARLGVVTVLMARKQATFSELKECLALTQGNLTIHLQKLEEAKYISIHKTFAGRKPRTTCKITSTGRKAFLNHLDQLRACVDENESGTNSEM